MSEQIQSSSNATSPDALGELLGKILGSQIQGSSPSLDSEQGAQSTAKNDSSIQGGDILSSLLGNPDLILKLPSIISAAKPIIELFSQSQKNSGDHVAKGDIEASGSLPASAKHSHITDDRSALLCAMKPYLSEERCQIIDYIVKLSRLGDILKTL